MISNYLQDIKGLVIDMDGVLWHDSVPLGDLPAIFDQIQASGLKVILATNNATRTIDEYHQKLGSFGVELEDWQVINSAQAAGIFLQEQYPNDAKVFVVGQPSLKKTLADLGFTIAADDDMSAEVVVASLDFSVTYEKLKHASLLIQAGCDFVGTNPDVTLPTPLGFIPGAGTIIGALEIASGKSAKIVGKPAPVLYEVALKRLELAPEETLAIGDRLETDIAGAQAAGIHTALVLSGASTRAQAEAFQPPPEIITQNLTELIF
ncbi:MAG: HAD-IIA family hydrolase [Brevefilum sp.]